MRTYYGAAEGHGGLCIFPAPHGPLSKVTLDGDLGTLAPLQGLSPSWASHRCWALGPSGWEGQALVLGPLFIVRVQLLWGLQSLGCNKGGLSLPWSHLGRAVAEETQTLRVELRAALGNRELAALTGERGVQLSHTGSDPGCTT